MSTYAWMKLYKDLFMYLKAIQNFVLLCNSCFLLLFNNFFCIFFMFYVSCFPYCIEEWLFYLYYTSFLLKRRKEVYTQKWLIKNILFLSLCGCCYAFFCVLYYFFHIYGAGNFLCGKYDFRGMHSSTNFIWIF